MNRTRVIWIVPSIWDTARVLFLCILLIMYDFLFEGMRALLYAALIGPFLVFPAAAVFGAVSAGGTVRQVWILFKVFGIAAAFFLGTAVAAANIDQISLLNTLPVLVNFLVSLSGICFGDLVVLGIILFAKKEPQTSI